MKLTTGILLLAMTAGAAAAQSPNILQNTKDKLNSAQQQRVDQENAALNGGQNQTAKPAPAGKPAPSVKPVAQTSKPSVKPVVQVKPVSVKPVTAAKSASAKPSTPSVNKSVAAAKSPAASTSAATSAKPVANSTKVQPAAATAAKTAANKPAPTRISVAPVAPQPKQGAQKLRGQKQAKTVAEKQPAKAVAPKKDEAKSNTKAASTDSAIAEPPKEKKTITAEGRRDPFISPVVSRASGPSCSVGKRCLAIDQITVRGVVKAESGMIAVVVNSINKAYFLKENDPVYNGYVVKITGDSVIFKETVQDRLGKESTREVVKKITTPAV